jgi:hypothetical protein
MDVAWQDSGPSFLDSSGTGATSFASFASDGGALWSSATDSPAFSSQAVLWESGADSPIDSHISAFTADSTTDAGPSLTGTWAADASPAFADTSTAMDGGLVWAGSGSDTSSSSTSSGGLGLGSLDLGAGSSAYQWQRFANGLAGQSATGLVDSQQLLWTGGNSQLPITMPVADVAPAAYLAPSDSLPLSTLGSLSPAQLVYTQPSGSTAAANAATVGASPYTPSTGASPVISAAPYTPSPGTDSAHGNSLLGFSKT